MTNPPIQPDSTLAEVPVGDPTTDPTQGSEGAAAECVRCLDFADVCPLCDDGRWIVETLSGSFYLVDLDAATMTRTPDPDLVEGVATQPVEPLPLGIPHATLRLRRDHDAVPILDLLPIKEGRNMTALLDVVGDGMTATWRSTNIVVSIRKAA